MQETKGFGMLRTVNVVDAKCGAGKTSWAIQYINESAERKKKLAFGEEHEKFIYVTPYLHEIDRIRAVTNIEFVDPKAINGKGSKMQDFKNLIAARQSIVTTHALFKKLDLDTLEMIEDAGYTLIMDEVANVLEKYKIDNSDFELVENKIEIAEDGTVIWLDEKYDGSRFHDIKILAQSENLVFVNGVALFWTMNVKAFEAFDDVYILTYLFDGQIQKYYYDMYDVKYKKHSVDKIEGRYELIEYNPLTEKRQETYNMLNIYEDYQNENGRKSTLNSNFDSREKLTDKQKYNQLSSTYLKKIAPEDDIKQLSNNMNNYCRNVAPTENNEIFWTTIKELAPMLKNAKCKFNKKDIRSKDNFVSLNMRATNDYADRTTMLYIYNRFMNPLEKQFFNSRGVKVNEDLLAVSDLIQFMFRGCIRKDLPMNCYIPSERMRDLLKQWGHNEL